MKRSALVEHLLETLEPLGGVSHRRMFGGGGLFRDGLMFALIADDMLYLKADPTTQSAFEAEGLTPFVYGTKDGRRTIMSYWRAPERLLDDGDEMVVWCRIAIDAARRAAAKKSVKRSPAGVRNPRSRAPRGG